MSHMINLNKFELRTDLISEIISSNKIENNIISYVSKIDDITITEVEVKKQGEKLIGKKAGHYTTIEFKDITDYHNKEKVKKVFSDFLKNMLEKTLITEDKTCLVIGLGNEKSTPDALGPLTIDQILVTNHLFKYANPEEGYRPVAAFKPNVTGVTGIETNTFIQGIVKEVKPDFLIVIDALASQSLERLNKTIQISNTGIHPGSGVGNKRKEISLDTLGIPVIAIGIPTVVDAITIVADTIQYMEKHYAFHKEFSKKPMSKLMTSSQINYLDKEVEITKEDKHNLLGLIGNLKEEEIKQLLFEILTPIGYNLIVTPKEFDFELEHLTDILGNGINLALHPNFKQK